MKNSGRKQILQRIVKYAKEDKNFFNTLISDPEKVINQLDFLDGHTKKVLLSLDPYYAIAKVAVDLSSKIEDGGCGNTCGGDSCLTTCGSHSCDSTCASSCGDTCTRSCGDTTSFVNYQGEGVVNPDPSGRIR